ncbi:MAG: hypothetical protein RM049_28165 [Nostoc sp. DedQUE04]|uniref:hypothetical protein n=1 Tax=Nostoc sp. DedQUE04 TaxID=3075390 RepID=UPI002AD1D127|nr:hypothetical protein [Nostoc sp. DedQUE04]MDZ8139112.1 hypothetical protein [Nostoc sp. DedQUE04]
MRKITGRNIEQVSPQCPMPNAQCPMPNAQCPIPNPQSICILWKFLKSQYP